MEVFIPKRAEKDMRGVRRALDPSENGNPRGRFEIPMGPRLDGEYLDS